MQKQPPAEGIQSRKRKSPEFFTSALRNCGIVGLIASILFGLDLMIKSSRTYEGGYFYFWLGAGLMFQGFVAYVVSNVFALILENLINIRKYLTSERNNSVADVASDSDAI